MNEEIWYPDNATEEDLDRVAVLVGLVRREAEVVVCEIVKKEEEE